jgi:uncharacterized protein (DUF58 family)
MATLPPPSGAELPELFGSEFLKKLEYLSLVAKKRAAGDRKGERRALRKGTSVEFADYRDYVAGDDLRRVDWNAYARIDKLLLKLFEEEEELFVYVLLDTSESMLYGEPSKLDYARKVAAALAYVGLSNQDRVSIATFASQVNDHIGPSTGKKAIFPMFHFLAKPASGGRTDVSETIRAYTRQVKRRGLLVLISDFIDEAGIDAMLKNLLSSRFEVLCLHLYAPEEEEPPFRGDYRFVDSETGEFKDVFVTKELLDEYKKAFAAHGEAVQKFCLKRAMSYVRASTAVDFDDLVMKLLRKGGFLR